MRINEPINPEVELFHEGFDGRGWAVTKLPCELSQNTSNRFAKELEPFLAADYKASFEKTQLPDPVKQAVILWRGEFTSHFAYMNEYL